MNSYLFSLPVPSVGIVGSNQAFPVRRIYAVGQNYADHAKEMGAQTKTPPFFFLKPADVALAVEANEVGRLPYPAHTQSLHHEVELVVALQKGGSNWNAQTARDAIFGFAVGLDMTRRDLQLAAKAKGQPWCAAKSFEHACPIGLITPKALVPHIESADIQLTINGEIRQQSQVSQMLLNIEGILMELSQYWTLAPGDLIYTGTPSGVGPVKRGDCLSAHITGLVDLQIEIVYTRST